MSRKVILFAIAFLLLIVVIWMQISKPRGPQIAEAETMSVVVASHDIPPYTVLRQEDVRAMQLSPDQGIDSFGGIREPVGLMTTTEFRSGSPIRRSEVLTPDAAWVQGDMLIFSFYVATDRIVGGQLRPGHHLDLLVTRPETRDQPAESLWLARNLWVVGVYQSSGDEVLRPTVSLPTPTPRDSTARSSSGGSTTGVLGFSASSISFFIFNASLIKISLNLAICSMSFLFEISTAFAKPTMNVTLSVPLLNPNSCPPPCKRGSILTPSLFITIL